MRRIRCLAGFCTVPLIKKGIMWILARAVPAGKRSPRTGGNGNFKDEPRRKK
jgi:hypothetical protein